MIDLGSSTFLIGIAIGLVMGVSFAGWWVTCRVQSRLHAQVMESGERAQRADALAAVLGQRREEQDAEVEGLRQALAESQEGRTKAETRLEEVTRNLEGQQSILAQARQELHDTFDALSGQALKQNNEAFLDLARTSFASLQAEAKGRLLAATASDRRASEALGGVVTPLRRSTPAGRAGPTAGIWRTRSTAEIYGRIARRLQYETAIWSKPYDLHPCGGAGEK